MIFTLEAQMRKTMRKSDLTKLRAQGMIPAVIYGPNMDTMSISINQAEFNKCYKKSFTELAFYELAIDNQKYHTILKDKLTHPVRRDFLHLDFQVIPASAEMEFELPINFIGEAAGAKEGGFVDIVQRTVKLVCQASKVPEISVDLSPLHIGDSIRIKDLPQGEWTYKDHEEEALVVVHAKRAEVEETSTADEAEAHKESDTQSTDE